LFQPKLIDLTLVEHCVFIFFVTFAESKNIQLNLKLMKQILKENRWFIIPHLIFLVFAVILLVTFSKPELHILSNKANSPFFDSFFKYATWLGDGIIIAILFVALLFVKYRYALAFLSGSLATSLLVNIFKKVLLHDVYRPSKYFELYETYQLHIVEGVKLHSLQSFPSGHTATAFAAATSILDRRGAGEGIPALALASFVGVARIKADKHHWYDVLAGAAIGSASGLLITRHQRPDAPKVFAWGDFHSAGVTYAARF